MIKQLEINLLKTKFAALLEMLYVDGNISLANINDKLISDPYFELLEKNQTDEFLSKSFDEYAMDAFGCKCFKGRVGNDMIYWASGQYMNVFLNCGIPIQQIALCCPLDEMCSHFSVYHEINERKLIDEFLANEYKRSILSLLRKKKNISIKELSFLTDIPEYTLRYYEKANENLFNASFSNISAIAKVFEVSDTLFKRKSDFIPYSEYLWLSDTFKKIFAEKIREIPEMEKLDFSSIVYSEAYSEGCSDSDVLLIYPSYFNENTVSEQLSKHSKVLFVNRTALFAIKEKRRIKKIYVDDKVLSKTIKNTIEEMTNQIDELIF